MGTLRIINLAMVSTEPKVCGAIDSGSTIKDFAFRKSRRMKF